MVAAGAAAGGARAGGAGGAGAEGQHRAERSSRDPGQAGMPSQAGNYAHVQLGNNAMHVHDQIDI